MGADRSKPEQELRRTVDHHVVADDGGGVEGSLARPVGREARAEGGPEALVHVEGVGGVDALAKSVSVIGGSLRTTL